MSWFYPDKPIFLSIYKKHPYRTIEVPLELEMLQNYKKLIFCFMFGFLIFITFNCIVAPESASAGRVISINIADENGRITTWGWWLVNILAPFFALMEFLKIGLGILLLPLKLFGMDSGSLAIASGWSNLTVMWPGLLFWTISYSCAVFDSGPTESTTTTNNKDTDSEEP